MVVFIIAFILCKKRESCWTSAATGQSEVVMSPTPNPTHPRPTHPQPLPRGEQEGSQEGKSEVLMGKTLKILALVGYFRRAALAI